MMVLFHSWFNTKGHNASSWVVSKTWWRMIFWIKTPLWHGRWCSTSVGYWITMVMLSVSVISISIMWAQCHHMSGDAIRASRDSRPIASVANMWARWPDADSIAMSTLHMQMIGVLIHVMCSQWPVTHGATRYRFTWVPYQLMISLPVRTQL